MKDSPMDNTEKLCGCVLAASVGWHDAAGDAARVAGGGAGIRGVPNMKIDAPTYRFLRYFVQDLFAIYC